MAEGVGVLTAAKNQYFTQDKKIVRKVAEMFMAFKIESELDKDTIFELYVNSILLEMDIVRGGCIAAVQ